MLSLFGPASVAYLKVLPPGGVGTTDPQPWTSNEIQDVTGLKSLADELNPIVGYWDPFEIFEDENGPKSNKENVAWFRHAEIKHGRVAMAAFVGYCVQSLGIHWPGNLCMPLNPSIAFESTPLVSFADISAVGGPADQWDALPTAAKCQILVFVGLLEVFGESSYFFERDGTSHYIRGGKPGYYPKIKGVAPVPLNLFDPFGFQSKMSAERKSKALLAEVNNGRLAMIGIFGLISASKGLIVPGLDTLPIAPYAGQVMAPFTTSDTGLPFVTDMLKISVP
jgi:hypothetical protein